MNNEKAIELVKELKSLATDSAAEITNILLRLQDYQHYLEEEQKQLDEDFKS